MEAIQDVFDPELDYEEETQKDKYLSFQISKESYGIDICFVTEIIVMQEITKVPDMPDFIAGVINLRGHVIPVMDLRTRFQLEPRPYDDRTCIVVVKIHGYKTGIIVDAVNEVLDIPESFVDPPPKTHLNTKSRYVKGLGKVDDHVKILLDVGKILKDEEIEQLSHI